jgi:protein tyrosine/serine phosphatase
MRLDWPDCLNARDLGGLPTASGRRIRTRALIRSDRLDRLSPAGIGALRAYGVGRIIDLRSATEVQTAPGPFAADPLLVHEPFIDEVADLRRNRATETSLVQIYKGSLDRNGSRIAAGLAAVANAPEGGVVIHCHAGKDRTGVLVALLLAAVGVPMEEIAADYAITGENLRSRHQAELLAAADEVTRENLRRLHSSHPENICEALAHLNHRYGGTLRYLATIGVTPVHLAALSSRLLED